MDDRHGLMGVDLAAAEARKMLAAGENVFVLHAGKEGAHVVDDAAGLGGDGAGAEDGRGFGEREIEDGREDGVATEGAGFAGDEPAVLTVKIALTGSEDGGSDATWTALSMLRRNRITPPGRMRSSQVRSSAESEAPPRPAMRTWPACSASCTLRRRGMKTRDPRRPLVLEGCWGGGWFCVRLGLMG